MKHHIRAVLFDLDGVVVFTDKYHYLAWKALSDEQGWDFNEEVNHACRGVPRMASLEVILRHNDVDLPPSAKEELADWKNTRYVQLLEEINETDLYPGAVPFIQSLRDRRVKIGLCSSSKNARLVLDKLGIASLFDTIITGHDFEKAKPDPEIFLLGASRLAVPRSHCVVFEDAFSGVQAALAAGMKCIGVGSRDVLPNAPEVITDYDEIDIEALLTTGRKRPIVCDPWKVIEPAVSTHRTQHWESIFAVCNGFLGLRGTHEEEDETWTRLASPGFYLNGIYEYEPYRHVVSFPGYPRRLHSMLNLCHWHTINLQIEDERFSLFSGRVTHYHRELDLEHGCVTRSLEWQSPKGRRVRIVTRRLASMVRRHSAAVQYEVSPLDGDLTLTWESVTHGQAESKALGKGPYTRIVSQSTRDHVRLFHLKTMSSGFEVGMAFTHRIEGGRPVLTAMESCDGTFVEHFQVKAAADRPVRLNKHAVFHTSIETSVEHLIDAAVHEVRKDAADGYGALQAEQTAFWKDYWSKADIEIEGSVADQMALRFAMYELRQSHPEDDHRSISACGITGDHYHGHVFWDTEMYMAPHFAYSEPHLQRSLLMYRYHILDQARRRAREMDGKGALFAWNSISGEECGVVYEASTAEYHLISAIAYATWRYVNTTGDEAFLFDCGAEMLFETARFWVDRGAYIPARHNQFCLNVVCGPDEYGCGVNNNCYTNVMAQWHLRYAAEVYALMTARCAAKLEALADRIGLAREEVDAWRAAADRMYVPYDESLGIHKQDDSFLALDPVDMTRIPLHQDLRSSKHPLNLWRMQVAKQADVVLLMLVQSHQFDHRQKRANYLFYEPRTNHGSSLSPSIHSILATEVNEHDKAYDYFRLSAMMDLEDVKENTKGGLHSACLGGTWMAVVQGFAGMRDEPAGLRFNPVLPRAWKGYRFRFRYKGRLLRVEVGLERTKFTLAEGEPFRFTCGQNQVTLSPDAPAWEMLTVRCAAQTSEVDA